MKTEYFDHTLRINSYKTKNCGIDNFILHTWQFKHAQKNERMDLLGVRMLYTNFRATFQGHGLYQEYCYENMSWIQPQKQESIESVVDLSYTQQ